MRNPSRNTIKKLVRQFNRARAKGLYWLHDEEYFLFNNVGARAYVMSKGAIENRGEKILGNKTKTFKTK